jgi:Lar family restriction alleviation protein
MEKLKPCPFCGGENMFLSILPSHKINGRFITQEYHQVVCGHCQAEVKDTDKGKAIKKWNTRNFLIKKRGGE